MKNFYDVNAGDVLCDTHYGIDPKKIFNQPTQIHSQISIPFEGGSKFVTEAVKQASGIERMFTNKMLVVICTERERITAAYSYDNRYLGLITFVKDTP